MAHLPRIATYVLAAFMAFMGIQKFIGDVPIFDIIEHNLKTVWGLSLPFIEPGLKYFTGVAELAAAALLIFGQRFLGGLASIGIIGGAILAHLTVLGVSTPTSSAEGAAHSPVLFIMALVFFAVSVYVTLSARRNS